MSFMVLEKFADEASADKRRMASVSLSFFPGSHKQVSDTTFRSSDSVLFYVNSQIILRSSPESFVPLLHASLEDKGFRNFIIDIPDTSSVLNVILHTMYGLSCAKYSPSLDVLETAVDHMTTYGLVPSTHIFPTTPLYELLLSHAAAIRVYSIAASHGLHDLAENASSHLLSYNLSDLTDDLAKRMGAKYLRRLMSLHLTRVEALKSIILRPPYPHPATRDCDFLEQKKLSRAWALAASYLAWDSRPDLSIHRIHSTFLTLGDHLTCDQCKVVLKERIKDIIAQWVNIKRTI